MALKKPLVLASGEIQQLQSGDDLDVPVSGAQVITLTNDEAGSVVIGAPAYADANDGFKKAKADAAATSKVVGLVAKTSIASAAAGEVAHGGVLSATTGQWDAVTGGSGGLVAGTEYFLSAATAGMITATAPTTSGQYVVSVGIALSTTEMKVIIRQRILL